MTKQECCESKTTFTPWKDEESELTAHGSVNLEGKRLALFPYSNLKFLSYPVCAVAMAGGSEREMGEAPAAETMDLDTVRVRMNELIHSHTDHSRISDSNPSDFQNLLKDFSHHLEVTLAFPFPFPTPFFFPLLFIYFSHGFYMQSRVNQIISQFPEVEASEPDDLGESAFSYFQTGDVVPRNNIFFFLSV